LKKLFLLFALTLLFSHVFTQEKKQKPLLTRILFIFDASQSMLGEWESDRKINIATRFLSETLDSLEHEDNVEVALRVYGHQSPVPPQDCDDTRLEVPFGGNNISKIRQELKYLRPRGTTPLAKSLELSPNDFPSCPGCRNIIILITDGIEACEGDPCKISQGLQRKGVILKPFIIGIGLDTNLTRTFECIGEYYNAQNEENFQAALNVVITQVLNPTSTQVNLLDSNGKPTETDVAMTFYDQFSNKIRYNYMHTINYRGEPDTIELDPLVTYKMVVHTIPPVAVDNIKLSTGKHTIIAADTPQGTLLINSQGNSHQGMKCIIRQDGKMETLNFQELYKKEKYIVGTYDLEIPTVPPLHINDVKIKQSHTATVNIPRPGNVTFVTRSEGYGSIFLIEGDDTQKLAYNLNPELRTESINLLPGEYIAVYRTKEAKQTYYTITSRFKIYPGAIRSVNLY